jgi:phosphate transport system substrate-binding protein
MIRRALPLFLIVVLCGLGLSCSGDLDGRPAPEDGFKLRVSGSTFVQPLSERWFNEYEKLHPEIVADFDGIGSGEGVKQFIAGKTDIGASDYAMTNEEMQQVEGGVQLVPVAAGSIVLIYNLPMIDTELKLSRVAYTGIFLGKITRWNDPAIADANPGLTLPDLDIRIAVRQDSSGTTFAFTNHLNSISDAWEDGPGFGTAIQWPHKAMAMKAQGNAGVAGIVKQTPGAIGYVELGFAQQVQLPMAVLENKNGAYIAPSYFSGTTALVSVNMPPNLRLFVPDPDGKDSYPIVTFTWFLLRKKYDDPKKAAAVKKLVAWCLTEGQRYCEPLGYLRLAPDVAKAARQAAKTIGP